MSTAGRLLAAASAALGAGAAGWLLLFRDQTTDSDRTGVDVPKVDVASGRQGLGERAVEVLNRHVGEHGQGPKGSAGYHRSPFIDAVLLGVHGAGKGLTGKPWCAAAVRWAFETAAQELQQAPPFAAIRDTLATAKSWKAAPFAAYKLSAPKVGAVLVLGDSHATLIAKIHDSKTVTTVEGNHGDAVANVKRLIGPGDTIVDVAAYVADHATPAGNDSLVAGLDLLGAEA